MCTTTLPSSLAVPEKDGVVSSSERRRPVIVEFRRFGVHFEGDFCALAFPVPEAADLAGVGGVGVLARGSAVP